MWLTVAFSGLFNVCQVSYPHEPSSFDLLFWLGLGRLWLRCHLPHGAALPPSLHLLLLLRGQLLHPPLMQGHIILGPIIGPIWGCWA